MPLANPERDGETVSSFVRSTSLKEIPPFSSLHAMGYADVAEVLLKAGADSNVRMNQEITPSLQRSLLRCFRPWQLNSGVETLRVNALVPDVGR